MTKTHNPHPGLDTLVTEITTRQDPRLGIAYCWTFAKVLSPKFGPLRRVAEYFELACRIWHLRDRENILVREFSTYYIFLTLAFIFPIRRKCVLLIAHNIQAAQHRPIEQRLLSVLRRLGLRFACLENDDGLREILRCSADIVFPHPVVKKGKFEAKSATEEFHVGVAGDPRPEKKMAFVLPILHELCATEELLEFSVGTNKINVVTSLNPDISVIDTTDQEVYLSYLKSLDVLVLPYPEDSYKYRASGVIAEATGAGTVVICTNLPTLSAQILTPKAGGVCIDIEEFSAERLHIILNEIRLNHASFSEALVEVAQMRNTQTIVDNLLIDLKRD